MKKFPSFVSFKKRAKEIDEIDQSIRSVLLKENLNHQSRESYPYIPFPELETLYCVFKKLAENLEKYYRSTFTLLDMGAGTGRIVMLAKFCGIDAKGVEFHKPYVDLGRKFYDLSEEELIVENGFNLKFDFLRQFRVIYTYMPIRNGTRMSALHFHLQSQAAYGTIFLEMLPAYYPMEYFRIGKNTAHIVDFSSEELRKIDPITVPAAVCVQRGYREYDEREVDQK